MSSDATLARAFRYVKPEFDGQRKKQLVKLAKTDRMIAYVQVVKVGGENNLHAHRHMDGLWMVLKGQARFHGADNVILGEYGPYEGILIPRNFAYWFESTGAEDLEILQVEAFDIPLKDDLAYDADRVNLTPLTKGVDLTVKTVSEVDGRTTT